MITARVTNLNCPVCKKSTISIRCTVGVLVGIDSNQPKARAAVSADAIIDPCVFLECKDTLTPAQRQAILDRAKIFLTNHFSQRLG
jgi:hypothetical protein